MKHKRVLVLTLFITILAISLTACGGSSSSTSKNTKKKSDPTTATVATYDGCKLEIKEAEKFTNGSGQSAIKIHATFTNNNSDGQYALSAFSAKAFQNGTELGDPDINAGDDNLSTEVKDGASIDVSYQFVLQDESTDVEFDVGEPTADETTLIKHTYSIQ